MPKLYTEYPTTQSIAARTRAARVRNGIPPPPPVEDAPFRSMMEAMLATPPAVRTAKRVPNAPRKQYVAEPKILPPRFTLSDIPKLARQKRDEERAIPAILCLDLTEREELFLEPPVVGPNYDL